MKAPKKVEYSRRYFVFDDPNDAGRIGKNMTGQFFVTKSVHKNWEITTEEIYAGRGIVSTNRFFQPEWIYLP